MIDIRTLKEKIFEIEKITEETWLCSIGERKKKELEFHDKDRDAARIMSLDKESHKRFYGNRKYYIGNGLSSDHVNDWIRTRARDKIFLDYACGNGQNAIRAAKAGARLAIGIDISRVSVENAKREAEKEGVCENTSFLQADAEKTLLPDDSIDTVICSGMLHHLNLSYAFPELRRILAPGGIILAVEALNYNPLIKLYRNLTPQMRTEWEKAHILSYKDIHFASRFFEVRDIRHWHLLSIAGAFAPSLLPLFNSIDNIILKFPGLKMLSWMFTFELHKKQT